MTKYTTFKELSDWLKEDFREAFRRHRRIRTLRAKMGIEKRGLERVTEHLMRVCRLKSTNGIERKDQLAYIYEGTTAPSFMEVIKKAKMPLKYKEEAIKTYGRMMKKQKPIMKLKEKEA